MPLRLANRRSRGLHQLNRSTRRADEQHMPSIAKPLRQSPPQQQAPRSHPARLRVAYGNLPRPRMALGLLGWALLGLPIPRNHSAGPSDTVATARSWGSWWGRHPRLLRLLVVVALGWS